MAEQQGEKSLQQDIMAVDEAFSLQPLSIKDDNDDDDPQIILQTPVGHNLGDTICSGWLKCHTSRDAPEPILCFWRLSRRAITMHQTDDPNCPHFEEVLMEKIINVEEEPPENRSRHVFVIRMSNGIVYHVGDISTLEERETSLQWMQQIRYWCVQSLAPKATFDILAIYDVDVNRVLGFGQFGVVYSAVIKGTGEQVAVKAIDPFRAKTRHIMSESRIPLELKHPGIIRIIAVHWTLEKIYIVSEKLHGDMLNLILSQPNKRLDERMSKFFSYQMICALAYLESKRVAHCDMKPENILLVSKHPFPQIKLCDFGYSKILSPGSIYNGGSQIGTQNYVPPEANVKNGVKPAFDLTVDTWSAGVIIYIFLTGIFPYNTKGDVVRQVQDEATLFSPQRWNPSISPPARQLVREMLSLTTQRRQAVMRRARTHAWFTESVIQTYQFWSDMKEFERRVNDEAQLRPEPEPPRSYWVAELGIDAKMEQLRASCNLPSWNEVGCQP